MAKEIRIELCKIIAEQLSLPIDRLQDNETLEALGADSLDRVEIVMNIEDHFSIEIDDEKAEKLSTIADVVAYIESLVNHKQ